VIETRPMSETLLLCVSVLMLDHKEGSEPPRSTYLRGDIEETTMKVKGRQRVGLGKAIAVKAHERCDADGGDRRHRSWQTQKTRRRDGDRAVLVTTALWDWESSTLLSFCGECVGKGGLGSKGEGREIRVQKGD